MTDLPRSEQARLVRPSGPRPMAEPEHSANAEAMVTYYHPDGGVAYRHPAGQTGGEQAPEATRSPPTKAAPLRPAPLRPAPVRPAPVRPAPVQSAAPGAAHKVVLRPTAAHRKSGFRTTRKVAPPPAVATVRPSRLPYRTRANRRLRSAFALLVLSLLLAGVLAASLIATLAGMASAISHAASN